MQLNLFQTQDTLTPCETLAGESDIISPPASEPSQVLTTSTAWAARDGSIIRATGQLLKIGDTVRHIKYWQGRVGELVEILEIAGRYHCTVRYYWNGWVTCYGCLSNDLEIIK